MLLELLFIFFTQRPLLRKHKFCNNVSLAAEVFCILTKREIVSHSFPRSEYKFSLLFFIHLLLFQL